MITVAQITKNILLNDPIAFEAARLGLLNLSAYCDQIKQKVEDESFKPVKKTTIVVALSRMMGEIKATKSLEPKIKLDDIVIKTPISDISFEKNQATIQKTQKLSKLMNNKDFITITQSTSEITIITPSHMRDEIIDLFESKPKEVFDNMVCITARFSKAYLTVPNFIYTIIRALAVKNINVIEVVSTYTELSVIVSQDDMQNTLDSLRKFF